MTRAQPESNRYLPVNKEKKRTKIQNSLKKEKSILANSVTSVTLDQNTIIYMMVLAVVAPTGIEPVLPH